ncbi:ClpP/crotonase [Violaceomyces palustris]|uniref:ClpP/crotonase n=2 Tax=Violaceomyces palustris TaxID=1673888 RepID=A0ACD0NX17_9BASI|nr:ClpP/crotonase [Violaceomyces palustris]PWN50369.1 ClpP/crotonase [Violaceomyces palustris]
MSFPQPYPTIQDAKYHKLQLLAPTVLNVSFDRPPVNAWIDPKWKELSRILTVVRDDPQVNVLILSGEGRAFTAGLDLTTSSLGEVMAGEDDPARKAYRMRRHLVDFQDAISLLERCEKPVISAVHGVAYGLGVDLMCATDIRYAEAGCRFSIKEVDAGLAADIGTLQRFPKIVGNDSIARELAFTAREFKADEALQIGFLSKVVQGGRQGVMDAALRTAIEISKKSPIAVRTTKVLMLHARDHSVQEGLSYTAAYNMAMLQSEDMPIAMASVMQKKEPKFSKL